MTQSAAEFNAKLVSVKQVASKSMNKDMPTRLMEVERNELLCWTGGG